jgi:ribonucleoside-diphosphate reductase alpha chain
LPQRRPSQTFDFQFRGICYQITCGFYDLSMRELGEIFIDCTKSDGDLHALGRDSGIAASIALQFGCPFDTLHHAITRDAQGRPLALLGGVFDALRERGIA